MRRTDTNTLLEAAAPRQGPVNPDHTSWQQADDERLAAMFHDNATDAAIADALGRSKKAVGLRRLGLGMRREATYPGTHVTPESRAAAVIRADEVGVEKAADEIGVHSRSVVRWRNGHIKKVAPHESTGPSLAPAPWSADDNSTVRSMFEAGKSDDEIGAVVGRAACTVGEHRRALGLRYRAKRGGKKNAAPTAKAADSKRRDWSRKDKRDLRQLKAAGLEVGEIAKLMGRTPSSVSYAASAFGCYRYGAHRKRKTRAPTARPPQRTSLARRALIVVPTVAAAACAAGYILWSVLS